jgi:hypothetical protein
MFDVVDLGSLCDSKIYIFLRAVDATSAEKFR